MKPVVTVVMPLYNGEQHLRECLLSLAEQSLRDFELIVVDDGSTDASLTIAKELEERFANLRIVCQQHEFAGAARNRGMDLAAGEYVVFLDSDDVFESELLEKIVKQMAETKADVCVFGAKRFQEVPGDIDEQFNYLSGQLIPNTKTFSFCDLPDDLFQITNPAPWTKAFRLDYLKRVNLRYQHHENANDIFFVYAALASARSICAINECLVWYRVRLGSTQHSKKSQPLAFLNALVCIKAHLIREGVYDVLEGTFLKMALANYEYNLRTAKQNEDTESLELLKEAYADYAAFELGLLRRQSDLPASIKGYYLAAFGRMEKLRSARKERKVGA